MSHTRYTTYWDTIPMKPRNILFVYWGRRGAIGRMTLGICRAAIDHPKVRPIISLSRTMEAFADFAGVEQYVRPVDTFSRPSDALKVFPRILKVRESLREILRSEDIAVVINVMWHIWSPVAAAIIRRAGVPYFVIVHDAQSHPGDKPDIVVNFMLRDVARATGLITLSPHVTDRLVARGVAPRRAIIELFHPEIPYVSHGPGRRLPGKLRLLFLGRIMRYKGLSLFVDALERLRASGIAFEAGVFGEGNLGPERDRLENLGAEIQNRWIAENEIGPILSRFDVVVASHVEASQSGVVAVSLGSGVPVVVTPVGGLPLQIADGINGIVAEAATSEALAAAIARLAEDPALIERLRDGACKMRSAQSAGAFLDRLVDELDGRWIIFGQAGVVGSERATTH
jgi:glycosyltransferase involved in cell wall biosynthesis